ncbi:DNA topoisomerase VI subunit B [archaeon CG10_big_fil_rev_8_21_14_0_10_43_11]|nr:MAG: DNA topoisomerase VI subunit B [archaeon CG10_big_fil_rev_8_21_14_0_10_43_11]
MAEGIHAEELAKEHKAVSVAEFFEKNRHLLGFGSRRQALITCVKEAVDNSLDACEEVRTLPDILVEIRKVEGREDRFLVCIEDNGPGIVKRNLSKAFGKLLYGSKFHGNKQGRGQQGIGITSCVLYSQLTTGKSSLIISKTDKNEPAHFIKLILDTKNNEPHIVEEGGDKSFNHRGTRVELEIEAEFLATGKQSIHEYLKRTSIVNPHARLMFITPETEKILFQRSTEKLPELAKRIKPHPAGLELGTLMKMLRDTTKKTPTSFMRTEFSSIGAKTAQEILAKAKLSDRTKPNMLNRDHAEALLKAMQNVAIQAPPLDCLSPIGEDALLKSIKSEITAEFYTTVTRKPTAYRGMPFQIEVGLAYGGDLPRDKKANVMRVANKVPLVYEDYACAITQAIKKTDWKRYGIEVPGGFPKGPLIVIVHMCSVWVPFTSEGKQAIAGYPEVIKEMRLGIMEAARKMNVYLRRKFKMRQEQERVNTFVKYAPEIANALSELTGEDEKRIQNVINSLLVDKYGEQAIRREG